MKTTLHDYITEIRKWDIDWNESIILIKHGGLNVSGNKKKCISIMRPKIYMLRLRNLCMCV